MCSQILDHPAVYVCERKTGHISTAMTMQLLADAPQCVILSGFNRLYPPSHTTVGGSSDQLLDSRYGRFIA